MLSVKVEQIDEQKELKETGILLKHSAAGCFSDKIQTGNGETYQR